ncbi:hypothetical protein PIB30_064476 [Stylosanthes scabra]|uniref:Uncharacterized protein n=1 Tax=Stylosanthes scabra TaxID=79078 RepID=A0ABU6ZKE7_9FABA|nr:hypothetical protein [Stylosanthes scabra]
MNQCRLQFEVVGLYSNYATATASSHYKKCAHYRRNYRRILRRTLPADFGEELPPYLSSLTSAIPATQPRPRPLSHTPTFRLLSRRRRPFRRGCLAPSQPPSLVSSLHQQNCCGPALLNDVAVADGAVEGGATHISVLRFPALTKLQNLQVDLSLSFSLANARDAAGIAGNIFAFGLFVSPIPTFRRIIRNGSTEMFSGLPYIYSLMNCLICMWYGMPYYLGACK